MSFRIAGSVLCDLGETSAASALESQTSFRSDARNAKGQLESYDNVAAMNRCGAKFLLILDPHCPLESEALQSKQRGAIRAGGQGEPRYANAVTAELSPVSPINAIARCRARPHGANSSRRKQMTTDCWPANRASRVARSPDGRISLLAPDDYRHLRRARRR